VLVYVGVLALANSLDHAVDEFIRLWPWMTGLVASFGAQVGLFAYSAAAARHGFGGSRLFSGELPVPVLIARSSIEPVRTCLYAGPHSPPSTLSQRIGPTMAECRVARRPCFAIRADHFGARARNSRRARPHVKLEGVSMYRLIVSIAVFLLAAAVSADDLRRKEGAATSRSR
jgi:hypothetical protein